ncbi:MAG: 7-carboxy-7-deazaguanine synthase QueE [Steroidobacteraceae bacterium]
MPAADQRLRVSEIFLSLQGEANQIGWPTAFVRLTGCPLRCVYCDTSYAFQGGTLLSIEQIVDQVRGQEVGHVCVTGGEPLAQRNCIDLLRKLCDVGLQVSLETSGAMSLAGVDDRVVKVVDLKTPASGECARNKYSELGALRARDQVKFVICDRNDYEWSRNEVLERGLDRICTVLFSPSHEQLPARDLAEWIIADRLPVRFQIQLHKYLWGNVPGR